MKQYKVDEFLRSSAPDPLSIAIDKKVSLLYDLRILIYKCHTTDTHEQSVRAILSHCKTECEVDNILHDLVRYNITLYEFLHKYQEVC